MKEQQQSYEEMLIEVETIIDKLQSEDLQLDQVVSMVTRGHALLAELKGRLDAVSLQITEIRDGSVAEEQG